MTYQKKVNFELIYDKKLKSFNIMHNEKSLTINYPKKAIFFLYSILFQRKFIVKLF